MSDFFFAYTHVTFFHAGAFIILEHDSVSFQTLVTLYEEGGTPRSVTLEISPITNFH